MQPTPASTVVPISEESAYKQPSTRFVVLGIALSISFFLLCGGLLLYRGLTQPDPNNSITVVGDKRWRGTVVTLSGPLMPAPIQRTLEEHNKFQIPIFLERGTYEVKIQLGVYKKIYPIVIDREGMNAVLQLHQTAPPTQPNS